MQYKHNKTPNSNQNGQARVGNKRAGGDSQGCKQKKLYNLTYNINFVKKKGIISI